MYSPISRAILSESSALNYQTMKLYRIDNQLLYNPADRSLVRIDDDLSRMVLSHISNRLFCLFLESDGSAIPRNIILQKVWDEHSLTASGSNLNNYISGLRKQLVALGLEIPLIITEPKIGFRIDAARVSVEVYPDEIRTESIPDTVTNVDKKPLHFTETLSSSGSRFYSLKRVWFWLATTVTAGTLILFLWEGVTAFYAPDPRIISGVHYSFTEGGCSFFTPENSYSSFDVENSRRVILSLVKKYSALCHGNGIVIYDLFGVFNNNVYNGRALVSNCEAEGNSIVSCKSYFIYSVNDHNE
ncbi:winged helix-turn-helix domain-containing protein [Pantoea coffeiphila]|uniref:winged helix-turn-helix domain-containing protein n=1 Tax=Pantoea coffeiphila TaxID=1465635 RepID=UPI00196005D7|nr:winged helix-turn-helix domain-containing protein [Pantoea coffeiphila]MBM7343712.1 DNA-binding winged helix-turn-helix (wHTH) protein [Pantoea coffeiphila]